MLKQIDRKKQKVKTRDSMHYNKNSCARRDKKRIQNKKQENIANLVINYHKNKTQMFFTI